MMWDVVVRRKGCRWCIIAGAAGPYNAILPTGGEALGVDFHLRRLQEA